MEARSRVLKMNEDKTMEFLDLYEKEECLWNTQSVNYKNRDERTRAANRVAKALNLPNFKGRHVVIKFKNLRNSYCQELRKKAASSDLGGEYKPKVFWFPKMDSFLRPHLSKYFGHADFSSLFCTVANVASVKEEENWEIPIDGAETTQEYYSEDGHSTASTTRNLQEPASKRRRIEANMDPLVPIERDRDYYDDFGRYIASLLRTLPSKKALSLQPKIVNLIADTAFSDSD